MDNYDEALDRADLLMESIRADVEADRVHDLAEAIMDDLNGEYDPTSGLDLDEGVQTVSTKIIDYPTWEDEEVAI